MFTMQYTKDGGRAVAMAMLPPPPTETHSVVSAWEQKKKSTLRHILKGEE